GPVSSVLPHKPASSRSNRANRRKLQASRISGPQCWRSRISGRQSARKACCTGRLSSRSRMRTCMARPPSGKLQSGAASYQAEPGGQVESLEKPLPAGTALTAFAPACYKPVSPRTDVGSGDRDRCLAPRTGTLHVQAQQPGLVRLVHSLGPDPDRYRLGECVLLALPLRLDSDSQTAPGRLLLLAQSTLGRAAGPGELPADGPVPDPPPAALP